MMNRPLRIAAVLALIVMTSCAQSSNQFEQVGKLHWDGGKRVNISVSRGGFSAAVTMAPASSFTKETAKELVEEWFGDQDLEYTLPWQLGEGRVLGILVNSGDWVLEIGREEFQLNRGRCYLFKRVGKRVEQLSISIDSIDVSGGTGPENGPENGPELFFEQ